MCTTLTVVSAFFVIPHWGVPRSASFVQSNCFTRVHGVEDVGLGRGLRPRRCRRRSCLTRFAVAVGDGVPP